MGNAQVLTLKLTERDRSQLISHWGQEAIPWSSRQVGSATCRIFVEVSYTAGEWPFAIIRPGPSGAPTPRPSLGSPHPTLLAVPICAALASPCLSCTSLPPASLCSCLSLTLYSSALPSDSLPRSCRFSFSFIVIYLHHEKQLSSKKSYLSQRSGFIFPSITLPLFLLLLHFSSLFCPRQARLCRSQGANKLWTRAL